MNNSYITIIKEKRTVLSRKRVPLNQNECTADFRIGVPFEQNLHMMPLVKTYAGKIHCMDHEDAIQELQLSILEALPYLNPKNGAGKCISYIEKSVIHRYYALCKRYLSIPASESIEDHDASLPTVPAYDDTLLDIEAYIRTLPKSGGKQQIFSYFFYEDLSDKEIAERMHLSRQYVNRIKKQLIHAYFAQHAKSP